MNQKLNEITDILKTLTLLETIELINQIKKIFNINILNNIKNKENLNLDIDSNTSKEEKNTFNVSLIEIPLDKKISILKVIRNITGLGLKESKDIVDNIPKLLKENIKKEEVDKIKNELESLGAKVQII